MSDAKPCCIFSISDTCCMNFFSPACLIPSIATSSRSFSLLAFRKARTAPTAKSLIQRAFFAYRSTSLRSQSKTNKVKSMAAPGHEKTRKRLVVACDGMLLLTLLKRALKGSGMFAYRLVLTLLPRYMDGIAFSPLYSSIINISQSAPLVRFRLLMLYIGI